jgi:uncharacterized protein
VEHPWLAFPAGICISTVVMCVGFGGGMFWMPFLLVILKLRPDIAIATSLLLQTYGTASGSFAYVKQKKADVKLATILLFFAVPGITVGAYIAHRMTLSNLELIIGLLAMVTAFVFVASNQKYTEEGGDRVETSTAVRHSWVVGIMAVASGMLTVNTGEWLIPIMQKKMFLKMSNAIATCILMTFGISLVGVLIHLGMGGKPNLSVALWGLPGVLIGGQIGPRLVRMIDERTLKEIFVFVLTLISIHLLYNSYTG